MLKVFVYGTLLPGEANYHVVERFVMAKQPGRVRGTLYDYGPYPGLVLDGGGVVEGEWLTLDGDALAPMDELEGYIGQGLDNDYERMIVHDQDQDVHGWVYVWTHSRGCLPIAGGSWRKRNRSRKR